MSSEDDSKKIKGFMKTWGAYISVFLIGGILGGFIVSLF